MEVVEVDSPRACTSGHSEAVCSRRPGSLSTSCMRKGAVGGGCGVCVGGHDGCGYVRGLVRPLASSMMLRQVIVTQRRDRSPLVVCLHRVASDPASSTASAASSTSPPHAAATPARPVPGYYVSRPAYSEHDGRSPTQPVLPPVPAPLPHPESACKLLSTLTCVFGECPSFL